MRQLLAIVRMTNNSIKYIYCLLTMLISCSMPTNTGTHCNEPRDVLEDKVLVEFTEKAKHTKVCTSGYYTYYFWVMSRSYVMDECKVHPKAVSVRCLPSCSIKYFVCYILLDNQHEYKQSYSFSEAKDYIDK